MIQRVYIMAGGKGVRLQPLTYFIPKPLIPIGRRLTLLSYTIYVWDHVMRRVGISHPEIYVVTDKPQVAGRTETIRAMARPFVEVILEKESRGTLDVLQYVKPPALVVPCDHIYELDYTAFEHIITARGTSDIEVVAGKPLGSSRDLSRYGYLGKYDGKWRYFEKPAVPQPGWSVSTGIYAFFTDPKSLYAEATVTAQPDKWTIDYAVAEKAAQFGLSLNVRSYIAFHDVTTPRDLPDLIQTNGVWTRRGCKATVRGEFALFWSTVPVGGEWKVMDSITVLTRSGAYQDHTVFYAPAFDAYKLLGQWVKTFKEDW